MKNMHGILYLPNELKIHNTGVYRIMQIKKRKKKPYRTSFIFLKSYLFLNFGKKYCRLDIKIKMK